MFKQNDIISFFGDSITADGRWIAEVYQHLNATRRVRCYNAGVSGTSAFSSLPRLYHHCLIYNPTYVVVMFGMNDIGRERYANLEGDPFQNEAVNQALEKHYAAYTETVERIKAFGATPILCTTTPYDEVSDVATENLGCDIGLRKIAEFVKEMAHEQGCPLVDFGTPMREMIGKRSINNDDRVHPYEEGHHVMAQIFLKAVGEIDTLDFDTPFVFSKPNRERYMAEQAVKSIEFVEHCIFSDVLENITNLTIEQKKQEAARRLRNETNQEGYIASCLRIYIEKIDFKHKLMSEVIRLTV